LGSTQEDKFHLNELQASKNSINQHVNRFHYLPKHAMRLTKTGNNAPPPPWRRHPGWCTQQHVASCF
jgi:hypothetical protein